MSIQNALAFWSIFYKPAVHGGQKSYRANNVVLGCIGKEKTSHKALTFSTNVVVVVILVVVVLVAIVEILVPRVIVIVLRRRPENTRADILSYRTSFYVRFICAAIQQHYNYVKKSGRRWAR